MKNTITLMLIMLVSGAAFSQTTSFEDYKKQREQELKDFASDRDSVMQQMEKDFSDYVERRNKEYAEYLKKEWERMQVFMGKEPEMGPKPEEMPDYEGDEPANDEKEVIRTLEPQGAVVESEPRFIEPIKVKPDASERKRYPTITIDFYGTDIPITADRSLGGVRSTGIKEENISVWFDNTAQKNFTPTVISLLNTADEYGMNDWGIFAATRQLARNLAKNHPNDTKLYTWFLLLQAGYDIRLARQEDNLVYLMPFSHIVYNTPRIELEGRSYYLIGGDGELPVFTYSDGLQGAHRNFDMNFYRTPLFSMDGAQKVIDFEFKGQEFNIPVSYDPVLINMLEDQPQAHMDIYLDADASAIMIESIEQNLVPVIQSMNETDQVSMLLKMVQTGFEYQTDIENFGNQRYMTPDEVIHYAYSDCDDRSVLFGWLVRNYAQKQVAALLFPEHLATAVHFENGNPAGDYVLVEGKEFVIADPTYINAPIGLTMPDFRGVAPTAWVVDENKYFRQLTQDVWDQVFKYGGRRGNNQNDLVVGSNGEIFITGYFNEQFGDGKTMLKAETDKRQGFVAALTPSKKIKWAVPFKSQGDATGFSLIKDKNNLIVVAGTFIKNISVSGKTINSENNFPGIFVAAFQPGGNLVWAERADLNAQDPDNAIAYALYLDSSGNTADIQFFNDPRESSSGLQIADNDQIVLTGTFGNTSGLSFEPAPATASGASADYADLLINKNREMISQNVESSIAGLFAAIALTKSDGTVFPGTAAQKAINKSNPQFSKRFPETFNNIGKINFLKNKSGVIEIRTENGDDVYFDKLRIKDRSTMKIVTLSNKDEKIEILSRIEVGKYVVWYPLNYIRLYRRTGDLLFDYRSNNTKVTLNIKKDLLK